MVKKIIVLFLIVLNSFTVINANTSKKSLDHEHKNDEILLDNNFNANKKLEKCAHMIKAEDANKRYANCLRCGKLLDLYYEVAFVIL